MIPFKQIHPKLICGYQFDSSKHQMRNEIFNHVTVMHLPEVNSQQEIWWSKSIVSYFCTVIITLNNRSDNHFYILQRYSFDICKNNWKLAGND